MEREIIMSPVLCCFGIMCVLIVGFLGLVIFLILKGRQQAWTGKIVDKLHKVGSDDDGRDVDYYTLVIKTDAGKTVKLGLPESEFKGYKIGDKMEKKSGKIKPFLVP